MPVHFNSFIPDDESETKKKLFTNMIEKYTDKADELFVSDDKKYIHMNSYFKDTKTGENIGKVIKTLVVGKKQIDLTDIDITLLSKNKVKLFFDHKIDDPSDGAPHYAVYETENERQFVTELINKYTLKGKNIEKTNQEVYISCFPFQLNIFENEDEINKYFGLDKEINIPKLGKKVVGLDPQMMSDGRIFANSNEPCSLIIGKIHDYNDVEAEIAEMKINFTIIHLETAIGIIPVAVNKENFDLREIAKNKLLCMLTDVKADLLQ